MKYNSTLVVGKNKTGKTRNILFNELNEKINLKDNLVILDYNQEYYNHFYNTLKENDYNIKVVNLSDPLRGDGWNPLSYIYFLNHDNKDKSIEMLEKMAKNIFTEENESDPFWSNMATNLFIGLSLILQRLSKNIKGSRIIAFSSIMPLLSLGEQKYKDENITILRKYVETLNTTDPVYVALSSIVFAPTDTKGSIMAVFKTKMNQYLLRENLVKSFLNNSFHETFINTSVKNTATFIIGNKSLNRLTNILIEQIFNEALAQDKNVSIVLDNYDDLTKFYNLKNMISEANHSNISLYITSINKENQKYLSNIERVIETKDLYTDEEDENIELPYLNAEVSYEENFIDIMKEELEKIIDNK